MLATSVYFEIHVNEVRQLHWITEAIAEFIDRFPWIGVLLILMLLDIITGILAAAINKTVSSDVSSRGVFKKVQMVIMVGVGMIFEIVHPGLPWGKIIAMLFITTEMLSITENAGRSGLPLPKQLLDMLARSKNTGTESQRFEVEVTPERKQAPQDEQTTTPTS